MKIKTAIWIAGILAVLMLIPSTILLYQNQKLKNQVAQYAGQLDINHKALTDSLQRAETKLAKTNEELDLFATANGIDLDKVNEDLQSLDAHLIAVASSEAKTTTVVHNHYASDTSTPSEIEIPICKGDGRSIDIHGYTKRIETRRLEDSNGMVVADVSFSAAQKRPWSSKTYGINYKILNTIGEGPTGQIILTTELLAENPEAQPGDIFRINSVDSRVLQAPPIPPEFDWWDPSLYLMTQLGMEAYDQLEFSASLSIGFSIWSYGNNWRFLGITAGYDAFQNVFRASLIPFLYNVGSPLPLLTNLYLGLDVGISHEANVSVGVVIGTRL